LKTGREKIFLVGKLQVTPIFIVVLHIFLPSKERRSHEIMNRASCQARNQRGDKTL